MATAAALPENVESLTLRQSLTTLTTAVSTDLPRVANRCAEKELISLQQLRRAQIQSITEYERSSELVRGVIDQVETDPQKFWLFLGILEESGMFESVVKGMQNKYTENKDVRKAAIDHPYGIIGGHAQNQEERLPPVNSEKERGSKIKYYPIHVPTYIFHLGLITFVACAVADFLDPINYIFTDSEHYRIPVSYRAKCTTLLVVVCVITIIAMKYGCHHHVYCYENSYRGTMKQYVFIDVLTYLVFACILSYLCNWLIPNHYFMRLFIYIVVSVVYTLSVLCCIVV